MRNWFRRFFQVADLQLQTYKKVVLVRLRYIHTCIKILKSRAKSLSVYVGEVVCMSEGEPGGLFSCGCYFLFWLKIRLFLWIMCFPPSSIVCSVFLGWNSQISMQIWPILYSNLSSGTHKKSKYFLCSKKNFTTMRNMSSGKASNYRKKSLQVKSRSKLTHHLLPIVM